MKSTRNLLQLGQQTQEMVRLNFNSKAEGQGPTPWTGWIYAPLQETECRIGTIPLAMEKFRSSGDQLAAKQTGYWTAKDDPDQLKNPPGNQWNFAVTFLEKLDNSFSLHHELDNSFEISISMLFIVFWSRHIRKHLSLSILWLLSASVIHRHYDELQSVANSLFLRSVAKILLTKQRSEDPWYSA